MMTIYWYPSLLLMALAATAALSAPFGIQSGQGILSSGKEEDGGSSFSGSMLYDADHHVVFLTGSTYGKFWSMQSGATETSSSSCFVSILSLPEEGEGEQHDATWLHANRLGNATEVDESCSAMVNIDSNKLYIGGSSDDKGILTSLRHQGSTRATQYGIILDIDVHLKSPSEQTSLLGGRLFHSTSVQSIRSMVTTSDGETVFAVSEDSDVSHLNPMFPTSQGNLIRENKYGTSKDIFLRVSKMRRKKKLTPTSFDLAETFEPHLWTKEIEADEIRIAGLELLSSGSVVLFGSILGVNEEFAPNDRDGTKDDWDGFITQFDGMDGRILYSYRVDISLGNDDVINGICRQKGQDEVFYVAGRKNYSAFLARMLIIEGDGIMLDWTKSLDAKRDGKNVGLRCAITDDGRQVYIGGRALNGATIDHPTIVQPSHGGDDIWLGQIDVDSQNWNWLKQMGTSADEDLSDLQVDKYNNLLVFGNTNGSFLRQSKGNEMTDVFVMSLARNGESINDHSSPMVPQHSLPPVSQISSSINKSDGSASSNGDLIAVVVVTITFFLVLAFFWRQRRKSIESYQDENQVSKYLKGFDDVEIDLKQSATGGWHGNYVNHDGGLRYFSSTRMEEAVSFVHSCEMSPLTHAAIVQDSLFALDDDDEDTTIRDSSRGMRNGAVEQEDSSYNGLVDAYNNTWDELSQHTLPTQPKALVDVDISDGTEEKEETWGQDII
mmetsp:Transcript_9403/g.14536  ORF Transcript_9403/g.14536 Transcript_9403/m.14536 type:complete len:722 (-) Transcript_9403:2554-4719(-)